MPLFSVTYVASNILGCHSRPMYCECLNKSNREPSDVLIALGGSGAIKEGLAVHVCRPEP